MNTIPSEWIRKPLLGYGIFALPSEKAKKIIASIATQLAKEFPGLLWTTPPELLHVTLCEIIMTLRDYEDGKEKAFKDWWSEYKEELLNIFSKTPQFPVIFNKLEVSESTIIVKGQDNGTFQALRQQIVQKTPLPKESRNPPDIIHSSIARYLKSTDMTPIQESLSEYKVNFTENIDQLHLIRIPIAPFFEYQVIKTFELK